MRANSKKGNNSTSPVLQQQSIITTTARNFKNSFHEHVLNLTKIVKQRTNIALYASQKPT